MTILCIETSTSVCSAAICKDGEPVKQCISKEASNHARLLPLYIEELLSLARDKHLSIDAVALSEGPGSYTGLRIGTSMAKGLCYGLNIPLIPVSTLKLLCAAAMERLKEEPSQTSMIPPSEQSFLNFQFVPMIDARRMEVYTAFYDSNLNALSDVKSVVVENENSLILTQLNHNSPNSFSQEPNNQTNNTHFYYFGDGAAKCQNVISNPNWHYLPNIVPESRYLPAFVERILDITPDNHVDLAYYEPFYLKEFIAAQSHVKGLK